MRRSRSRIATPPCVSVCLQNVKGRIIQATPPWAILYLGKEEKQEVYAHAHTCTNHLSVRRPEQQQLTAHARLHNGRRSWRRGIEPGKRLACLVQCPSDASCPGWLRGNISSSDRAAKERSGQNGDQKATLRILGRRTGLINTSCKGILCM